MTVCLTERVNITFMEKESTRDIGKNEAVVGLENKANKIKYQ